MDWENSIGRSGAELANDLLVIAHMFADRVSVFRHKSALWWSNYSIWNPGAISPIPWGVSGGTSYDSAMMGAMDIMSDYTNIRTCVYFVGDGTGSYTPAKLN